MIRKFTLLFLAMLTTSIDLFANAEIVIYKGTTNVAKGAPMSISKNNFMNFIEEGDKIIVTVSNFVSGGGAYWQIQWSNWTNVPTIQNGDVEILVAAADVTAIKDEGTHDIIFSANEGCTYTITQVKVQKNDSYADLEAVTLDENSYNNNNDGTQYQKVWGSSTAALKMSDGDLLVVVGNSDVNPDGSWSMRELSTWNNVYSTGSFDGRDYAYIVASGKGSRIHADGFQFVTNREMSAVKIAKKIYSLSQSETPDFSSIVQNSPINVKLTRTLKSGWNTICLPFATTATDIAAGAEVYTYTSADASKITLTKVDGGAMTAGQPYMLYITGAAPASPITFTDVTVSTTTAGSGSEIDGLTFKGNFTAGMSMQNNYGLVNSTSTIQKGGSNATLPAFGAYFEGTKPASTRGFSIEVGDGTTGINGVANIENEENGPAYNLMGQQTMNPRKGIYIKNGRKYIAK